MARRKVKIAYIANDSMRRAVYRKRSKGAKKKVSEIGTLCGITACSVVFVDHKPEPDVWPSSEGVMEAIERFKSLPEMEQKMRMSRQEDFLQDRLNKIHEKLCKQELAVRGLETTLLMLEGMAGRSLNDVGIEHAGRLASMIEQKASLVQERIRLLMEREVAPTGGANGKAPMVVEAPEGEDWAMVATCPNEYNCLLDSDPNFPWN